MPFAIYLAHLAEPGEVRVHVAAEALGKLLPGRTLLGLDRRFC